MKSIIEQASSIIKAIEKAWDQAEQPKEFSIKIFEKEERNFFGMSVKPAKVGIFFGDKPTLHEKPTTKPRQEIKECRPEVHNHKTKPMPHHAHKTPHSSAPSFAKSFPLRQGFGEQVGGHSKTLESKPAAATHTKHNHPSRVQIVTETPHPSDTEKLRRIPTTWNDTMIATTHNWIKQILSLTNMSSVNFNSEVTGKNLKLTFNAPLAVDSMQEKLLFRSFAHLIMSSLRNQYKQEIKDLKVILTRSE